VPWASSLARGIRRRLALGAAALALTQASAARTAAELIAAAGDAASEPARLAQMQALAADGAALLDEAGREELAALLPVMAAWTEGRARAAAEIARGEGEAHRYLHRFFNNDTRPFLPAFPRPPRTDSPLYPLWAFYRGRFLTWFMFEHSEVLAVPERKALFLAEAERCFDAARRAFPRNPVLAIYAGQNEPASGLAARDERAPDWANHERRALEQLHAIIRWWIAERQLANGEFGGNWGDDVEMWRWWSPVLIGFDDPVVTAAQERLARGNLSRPSLAAGYTSQLTDVEHTAEETADTLTPMLHVAGDAPEWIARVHRLVTLADRTWWGDNAQGRRQFKHIDFNHERLGADATRAYDTGYHVRVMQPALLLWQRTNDPVVGPALVRWLRTWADAAVGDARGKPSGIVPSALEWPAGLPGSPRRGWVGPDLGADPMESLYSWPGYPVAALTTTLLQAHVQTGEAVFLEPLRRMSALRRAHLAAGDPDGPIGSPAWAARRLPAVINDALAKWRQLSGDTEFDDLLARDANGYVRTTITQDRSALTAALAATAATLSVNWPMFTSEVRYTDRVLSFPHAWPRAAAAGLARVDPALLYSSVTGDPGAVDHYPLNGVRWHTLPREIAALVDENRRDRFSAELYHFGPAPRSLDASLLLLQPGRYTWTLADAKGRTLAAGTVDLSATQRRLPLTLPSRVVCRLSVRPAP
jgi:hypothetical protein